LRWAVDDRCYFSAESASLMRPRSREPDHRARAIDPRDYVDSHPDDGFLQATVLTGQFN